MILYEVDNNAIIVGASVNKSHCLYSQVIVFSFENILVHFY